MFCRNLDTGDFVVVINADKIRVTGNKAKQKLYYRHSGYPGGLKSISLEKMMQTNPTRVIELAVKGMLPHTRLGAKMIKKLRVYVGDTHPHLSQTGASSIEATN
jgi:large subunit ribosomal protein L13